MDDIKERKSKINYPLNRFGKFIIREEDLDESRIDFVKAIMSKVIVTHCEYIYSVMEFQYEGLSDLFDYHNRENEPPLYVFYLDHSIDNGKLNIGARKAGENKESDGKIEFRQWT